MTTSTTHAAWAVTVRPKGGIDPWTTEVVEWLRLRSTIDGAFAYVIEKEESQDAHLHGIVFDRYQLNNKNQVYSNIKRDFLRYFEKNPNWNSKECAVHVTRAYKPGRIDDKEGDYESYLEYMAKEKDQEISFTDWPEDDVQYFADHIPLAQRRAKVAWKQMDHWRGLFVEHELPSATLHEVMGGISVLSYSLQVAQPPDLHKRRAFGIDLWMYINKRTECALKVSDDLMVEQYEERQAKKRKIDEYQQYIEGVGMTMRMTERVTSRPGTQDSKSTEC